MVRIARLMEQAFEGKPYFGPSLLEAVAGVDAYTAASKPQWSAHSIWDIIAHLSAELVYARQVLDGTAPPYGSTWPPITDTSPAAWEQALTDLQQAHRALVGAVKRLDDGILDQKPPRVRGPYYLMLHGTLQHTVYHAGQLSLLRGQMAQAVQPVENDT